MSVKGKPAVAQGSRRFAKYPLAMLASLVLVATIVTPTQAAEQAAPAPSAQLPDQVVSPIDSPAVEVPKSVVPQGEFENVQVINAGERTPTRTVRGPARYVDTEPPTPQEIVENGELVDQTEFTDVFRDGSLYVTVVGREPLNALDANGSWVDVETKLDRNDEEDWSIEAHPLRPEFSKAASASGSFTVEREGYTVRYTLEGAADSPFTRDTQRQREAERPDTVTYYDVFENVDLRYDIERGGVKGNLILNALPAPSEAEWIWTIDADGLDLVIEI